MSGLMTLKAVTKVLMPGVFVAALMAVAGLQAANANAQGPGLWSIVVHFTYEDGFEFDYVLQRGVAAEDLGAALAECGRSHSVGSVVRYHCYPVPE